MVVILDVGSCYTRAGFAGEFEPRCVWPTQISTGWIIDLVADGLLVPKLTAVDIVVLLSPTASRSSRRALVAALDAAGARVAFAPSLMVAAAALPTTTAFLVDVGAREARVMAVCEGYAVEPSLVAGCHDDDVFDYVDGVPALIERSLAKAPIDARRRLMKNIATFGGKSTDKFEAGLIERLRRRLPYEVGTIPLPFPREDLAWVGGSLLVEAAIRDNRLALPTEIILNDPFAIDNAADWTTFLTRR